MYAVMLEGWNAMVDGESGGGIDAKAVAVGNSLGCAIGKSVLIGIP